MKKIRPRERDTIIQSLRAGVTPKVGIQHIQVGRAEEIQAVLQDIERVIDGGAAFRLIVGDFGSGKSFFLQLIRSIALEKGLVTMHADLSPDRRLHATSGQARNLYSELTRNMATRMKGQGAMDSVVEKFITQAEQESAQTGEIVDTIIQKKLASLTELVGGYDFAQVIRLYWQAHQSTDTQMMSYCIRWLRGEYATRTDAKRDLEGNVRTIIDDESVYDHLKLMSLFVRQAGYKGLLINIDELVNLYKLQSRQARTANYEQILRILNDCLQGTASHLGFMLGGTPEFLVDPRKGLYSYEALHSRLAENAFAAKTGTADYTSPVLRLANLRPEEMYILLQNLRHVYAAGNQDEYLIPDQALVSFLDHCHKNIGEAYFRTPRNTIKEFLNFLAVLEQNKTLEWDEIIQNVSVQVERNEEIDETTENLDEDDELTQFQL